MRVHGQIGSGRGSERPAALGEHDVDSQRELARVGEGVELLRVDRLEERALQHLEAKGEVCPANWSEGKEAMKDTHDSVADYLAKN